MLNKIYKTYELNKKYGIRKLSIGITSVSLGLFGVYNTDLASQLRFVDVVKADENLSEVIYSNPNPSEEIDKENSSNNTISKITIIEKSDKKIKLRINFADGLAIKNSIKLKLADGLYSNTGSYKDLIFNNEVVGTIPPETETRIKSPEGFKSFEDYNNYLNSLSKDSAEMNTILNINFNENFKKYDKNRFVDIEINKANRDSSYIIHYIKKDEPKDATTIEMDNYSKEIPNKLYLNNKEIYDFGGKHNLRILNKKYTEKTYKEETYKEDAPISYLSGRPQDIKNKPFYLTNLYVMKPENIYRQSSDGSFILKNTSGKKVFKKGTKIKIEAKSNVVETLPLETTEKQINFYAKGEKKYKETEIFKGKQLIDFSFDTENKQESKTNVALKRISDKIYEMEILEDVVFENEGEIRHELFLPSEIFDFKLKDNYIDFLNKEEYLKALKEDKLSTLLGRTEVSIKEPDNTEFKKIQDYNISGMVNKSYVFGESSTGTVKVVYVDENNKEIIPTEKIVENQPWYNVVEIPKKEFDGYEFVSTTSPLKDLVMPGERTVTLKYKSTEKTREIPFNTIYEADNTKNKNEKETVREGVNGEEKYKSLNGEDIPGSVRVTKEKVDKLVKVGTKPKEVITKLPSPIKYVKDDTKEKGLPNERIEGKTGTSTVITTYTVDPKTGEITENVGDPVVVNPTETIIKVPAKTKIERIKNGSKIIEKTTTYDVNPENGNITETVTEKIVSDNSPEKPPVLEVPEYTGPLGTIPLDVNPNGEQTGNENYLLPPIVDELPEFNGGVNPSDAPVNEKPEYTGPLSTNTPVDENGNLILPPIVDELPEFNGGANPTDSLVNEKPEYTGPLSTNTPVDENGNLILPPVVEELPEFNGGVNPIDSPVLDIPEYTGPISTNTPVDDNGNLILPPVVDELPEFNGGVVPLDPPIVEIPEYNGDLTPPKPLVVEETPKEEPAKPTENKPVEEKKEKELPNTNSSSILSSLVSSVIGTLGLGYKSKRRK